MHWESVWHSARYLLSVVKGVHWESVWHSVRDLLRVGKRDEFGVPAIVSGIFTEEG